MKSLFTALIVSFSATFYAQEAEKTFQQTTVNDTIKSPKINELEGVTIFGNKKQFVKVDADKTTISIKENPMLSTGNALEAVKKLPGVITSPTGSLTLNGKGVAVYIDNAPSTLSGQDLQNYLSSLPANAIEKVELIYNPGAAFDANASGSIINIITSSRRMKGINASFNINYNFNKYQKPSPQILLNGKEKDLSWQTMIGYNYIDSENRTITNQTFTAFTPNKVLEQENFSVNTNRNFYWRTGTNYKLSDRTNFLLNYNLYLGNDRTVFDATTFGENIDYYNNGISKTKHQNHELSLQYKTKLDTLGRTLDITGYSNLFKRNPITNSDATDFVSNENYFNNGENDFDLKNYYLKYDFNIPFEKYNFSIATGGKYNILKVDNVGDYFINSPTANTINFDYTENNLAFYAEARKKIKKFSFTLGLRFEDFNVERISSTVAEKIKFRNTNLFPNMSAIYEINDNVNLSASYSRKINQPNYNTLDPNNSSTFDQYNSSQGNIFLNPTFFDNYEFKVSAMQFIQFGANFTRTKDNNLFIFSADANATEPVSNQTFQQFKRYDTFSAFLSFPIPLDYFFKGKEEFQKRMNYMDKMNYIFLNINYVKNEIEGFEFPYSNKAIWNYSAQAQFILPWEIKNTITYFIVDKGNWEIYKITKPIQQFDISFHREFMDKKLKLGLHCFDVFNANEVNALVGGQNLNTTFYQKQDSRTFRISLTYNFGNLKLQKENTNIDVEKVQSTGGFGK
ncbi:TonB-dependent receptor domain-containing protein [Flavobacterium capsici]|uniref:TonB-dependent receptor n=1 Tax=Flavobacterium capsici TaxID=3075618 RepID=A0AA96J2Q9_9FLAO|nr:MULTISPECIES: TonB-dependent receptor [unclassified Flavobacterium]WNM19305.1 TonB-dependent receptor [Flavobacterium sp. PMR2A8]WNM20694.1 TonB-dependent receptor [Flavobacterium sp. PMTSA4]